MRSPHYDVAIIGAGFAGLNCARAAARRGLNVLVLDRQSEPGARVHTTGLLVKEAAERWEIPAALTRRVAGVRLHAPSLATLDLAAPGYYFLATDTRALLRWFAREAARAGAHLRYGRRWAGVRPAGDAFEFVDGGERAHHIVGADGPHSAVAGAFGLGRNTEFLSGVEGEYEGIAGVDPDRLHCYLDGRLARGYIGWVVPGHGDRVQVGLACRRPDRPDLAAFVAKLGTQLDFRAARRVGRRGGLIPVGGPVARFACRGVVLVGDAAGLVSPLSAGGIHTALDSGFAAAHAIADHRLEGAPAPEHVLARAYPRFAAKRALRRLFDQGVPDALFDAALRTRPFTALARSIYFHHRGLRAPEGWRDLAQTLLRGDP